MRDVNHGLQSRLKRLEGNLPFTDQGPITEVHYRIINPDRTPVLGQDGEPLVIVQQTSKSVGATVVGSITV